MVYPILSSEQGIVCLQLFQALKIPLYSLRSQLNEDHLRNINEMMSFALSLSSFSLSNCKIWSTLRGTQYAHSFRIMEVRALTCLRAPN